MLGYRVLFFDVQILSYIEIDWVLSKDPIQLYNNLLQQGYDPDIVIVLDERYSKNDFLSIRKLTYQH